MRNLSALVAAAAVVTAAPDSLPRLTKLSEHVYLYEQIDPTKRGVTANNLVVVTGEGVLVADGQATVANVQRLLADIAAVTDRPVTHVVVGSEHGDHTGGDSAFPARATFLVHPSSTRAVEQRIGRSVEQVSDRRVLRLGGVEIQVLFLGRAHTGGDLEVYLPAQKILFMSEVFSNRIFPSMANGYPTEWIETLKKAEQMDATTLLPAHGAIDAPRVTPAEERTYRAALERVLSEGRRLHGAGVPAAAAAASADFGPFAAWTRRAENAAGALDRVYKELDGQLK